MIDIKYSNAFTEVLELFDSFLSEEDYKKIPEEKIEYMRQNANNEYKYEVNEEKDLMEQEISKEAKAIIISLYNTYFATIEQKKKINYYIMLHDKKVFEENDPVAENKQSAFSTENDPVAENTCSGEQDEAAFSIENDPVAENTRSGEQGEAAFSTDAEPKENEEPTNLPVVVHENIFARFFRSLRDWFSNLFRRD